MNWDFKEVLQLSEEEVQASKTCGEPVSLGNGGTFRRAATEICLVVRIWLEGVGHRGGGVTS